jgi:hypothetical protein
MESKDLKTTIRSVCERLYDKSTVLVIPSEVVDIPNRGKISLKYSDILEALDDLIKLKQEIEEEKGNAEEQLFSAFFELYLKLKKQEKQEKLDLKTVYEDFTLKCYLSYTYCNNSQDVFSDRAAYYNNAINKKIQDEEKMKNKMKRERQKAKKREERSKIRSFVRIKRPQPGAVFTGIIKAWDC